MLFATRVFFLDKVSLSSAGYPETHDIDQAGFELAALFDSSSPGLGVEVHTTTPAL